MSSQVSLIIFDFDGVIVNPMHPGLYKGLSRMTGVPWEVINRVTLPIWVKARVGDIHEDEYWCALGKICRLSESTVKEFSYSFCHPLPGVNQIVTELSARYKMALLSNHLEAWFKHLFDCAECGSSFKWVFTSFSERLAKPNPALYQRVVNVTKFPAEECLLIDDIPRNVEAATKFGMKAIRFIDASTLRKSLSDVL